MDAVRDLGRIEPWQESLERSRARRHNSRSAARTPNERDRGQTASRRRPAANRPRPATNRRRQTPDRRRQTPDRRRQTTNASRARRRKTTRWGILAICVGAIFAFAFPVGVLPSPPAARSTQASGTAVEAVVGSAPAHPPTSESRVTGAVSRETLAAGDAGLTNGCQPPSGSSDYLNPLAGARVRPERIDQGVDYAGSGSLAAIGAATVTYVASAGTGWPGSFIEYRLLDGPDSGCYVYYAEGVQPAAGLRVGESVAAGQPLATIIPGWSTGIELGWAAGTSTSTYAAKLHQWNAESDQNSIPSAAGKSFSALIASLGGPAGKAEG